MNKVFLGGTCNNSTWRDELTKCIQVNYFNPVVKDWDENSQAIEITQKDVFCNIHLYVITKEMTGVFSIAEVIDSVHTQNKQTILHVMPKGFDARQLKSLEAVCSMVIRNGGVAYIDDDLLRTARLINNAYK